MPPPVAGTPPECTDVVPFGRPVRRRVAVPLMLALGVVLAGVVVALHNSVIYYRVDSDSMQPTLRVGSRVAVEPGLRPAVGEMVVFHPPAAALPATPVCGIPGEGAGFPRPCGLAAPGRSHATFVKRIVAGPGDFVGIQNGRAVVNGVVSPQPFAAPCESPDCNFPASVRVPAGDYYVLGDNRSASDDSRFWGPVPASSIVGVLVRCGPLQLGCQPRR